SPAQSAMAVDVTVTTPGGTSAASSGDRFSYTQASAPAVTGLDTTSGSTAGGTVETISGTNFMGATNVRFGSMLAALYTVLSDSAIVATSPPEAAGTVDVIVSTPTGTS